MKYEIAGQAGSGAVLASATAISQFGTTWEAVLLAVVGALLAVLELETRRVRTVLMLAIFNIVIGSLAAPIIVTELGMDQYRAAVVIVAFLGGYVGHDLFLAVRDAARARIIKKIGGQK